MNKNQFNVITKLQSGISTIYKSKSDDIIKQFDSAINKIIKTCLWKTWRKAVFSVANPVAKTRANQVNPEDLSKKRLKFSQ